LSSAFSIITDKKYFQCHTEKPKWPTVFTRSNQEEVCVEPRPSALNMTLPAFAAERGRLQQISIDSWYAAPAAIDRSAAHARAQQQPSHMPFCCRSTGQTDRQTDGHPTVT